MAGDSKKEGSLKMECEPELPEIPLVDKPAIRNILYTAWSLQQPDNSCISWNVQKKSWGYIVSLSFGSIFSASLQDLQMIKDLSPLRIDNVIFRNPEVSTFISI